MPTRPYQCACVFVVDVDHDTYRQVEALCANSDLSVRPHTDAADLLRSLRAPHAHGCIVANLHAPDMSGVQLQREAAAAGARLPFIFLTERSDVGATAEAMRQGAIDVLVKPVSPEILQQRIAQALAQAQRAAEALDMLGDLEGRAARLTLAEREVLERVVQGLPNKTIASELGLHVKSVEARRARAMRKMGAQSLPDLVRASVALSLPRDPGVIACVLSIPIPQAQTQVELKHAAGSESPPNAQ